MDSDHPLASLWNYEASAFTVDAIEKAFIGRVRNLTLWGASLDNLVKRPEDEVKHLYGGFQKHLQQKN